MARLAASACDASLGVITLPGRGVWLGTTGKPAAPKTTGPVPCREVQPPGATGAAGGDHPTLDPAMDLAGYPFSSGLPLLRTDGAQVGTVAVADDRPRDLTPCQLEALRAVARLAVSHFEQTGGEQAGEVTAAPHRPGGGQDREAVEQRLVEDLEVWFRLAFDNSSIGMALVDLRPATAGRLLQANQALGDFLGYPAAELRGLRFPTIAHTEDRDAGWRLTAEMVAGARDHYESERRFVHRDGTTRWGILHTAALRDPSGSRVCALAQLVDLTDRHRYEEELRRAAETDPLTGLPNRHALLRRLGETLARRDGATALLVVDLDGFKVVNKAAGHLEGDEALRGLAGRFAGTVRAGDVVARIGGDEFAVLCPAISCAEAIDLAEGLLASLGEPLAVADREVYLSASVGVAWTEAGDVTVSTLLENADSAVHEAKRRGRARWELFDNRLRSTAALRLRLATGLRAALRSHQFELHYQPIVELRSGRVTAAEALLRWNHPEEGMILPADFMSVAEENGLIVPIGRWVLQAACAEAVSWGPRGPAVSVNVSARQLAGEELAGAVEDALVDSGLPAHRLTLEVTETAVMDDAEHAVAVLRQLKDLGVRVAVDDFGTGYSSLRYLKRLPVDELKIDRSFVAGLPGDTEDTAIVTTVVALARAVGLEVVAEGVETRAQWDVLRGLGCDFGQGFLWGRPVPAAVVATRFSSTRTGAPRRSGTRPAGRQAASP